MVARFKFAHLLLSSGLPQKTNQLEWSEHRNILHRVIWGTGKITKGEKAQQGVFGMERDT